MIIVPAAGIDIALSNVAAAGAGLVALAWCFAGIAFLVGAATGKRTSVLAVTGVLAVATYMANAIGGMLDGWHWLRWLSPFHYLIGNDPLHTGRHPAHLLTLTAVAAATTITGIIVFDRRDVGV